MWKATALVCTLPKKLWMQPAEILLLKANRAWAVNLLLPLKTKVEMKCIFYMD
jgi:hypothetical protein